jgi:uncharacterized membrane protein YdbT with pleckstrin-like domain
VREETILRTVAFDPALKLYWLIQGAWIMLVTVVCVPLLPFWLLGLGQLSSAKAYKRLECQLTTRSLHLRKGWIFRVERTIPLDKIQDLAMHEGPILRAMGLSVIKVETAGQSGQSGSDAVLVGVIDAPAFRDAVLEQRDRVTETSRDGAVAAPVSKDSELAVLEEIRDSLVRIEDVLKNRDS